MIKEIKIIKKGIGQSMEEKLEVIALKLNEVIESLNKLENVK